MRRTRRDELSGHHGQPGVVDILNGDRTMAMPDLEVRCGYFAGSMGGRTKEAGDSASARIRSVSPGQDSKSKSRKRSTRGSKSLSPSRASRRPSLIGTSIAFSPTLSSSQKAEINSELPPEQHLQNMETLFDAALNEVLLAMYTDSFTRFECA